MTVRELCDYAIKRDNWGSITVLDDETSGYYRIDYCNHNYCRSNLDFPEKVLNAYVDHIDWDGG